MATVIDNLGRKIDSAKMSLGEIKGLIGSLMKSTKVGPARPVQTKEDATKSSIDKLKSIFEKHTKDYAQEVSKQKTLLTDVVDNLKSIAEAKNQTKGSGKPSINAQGSSKGKIPVSKEEKLMAKSSDGLYKTFAKKGSGYTHDIYCEHWLKEIHKAISSRGGRGGSGGGRNTVVGATTPSPDGDDSPLQTTPKKTAKTNDRTVSRDGLRIADDLAIINSFISQITNDLSKVENYIAGWGNTLSVIFKDLDKERKFVQDMRELAYEVTPAATKNTEQLNRKFEKIENTVRQTGVDRTAFQTAYASSIKSGIKDLKLANSITKSQLNTERQLGMEADSLGKEFQSWTNSGRMTASQIADMGRGMREVARNTGLTGKELAQVVSGSAEYIKTLRSAANLTSSAAKNIIEIQANAQKLDVSDKVGPLLKAISSSSDLLLHSSKETQNLLFMAAGSVGKMGSLMNGTLGRSKKGLKDLGRGMENVLKQFGVNSLEAIDQLSDDAKTQLNLELNTSFGMDLGDFRSTIQTIQDSSKTVAEKLDDINKKQKQNLTLEERSALLEEKRRLKTNKNLEVLTALDEAAKNAKDMNQALATFGRRRGEFEADLSALGQAWTNETDVAKTSLNSAISSVNEGLKKAGEQEIKVTSTDIEKALKDPSLLRELTSKINDGEQKLATAQKAQLDPMRDMAQSLNEINDNIRSYVNSGISALFNSLIGKIGAVAFAIGTVVAGLALLTVNLVSKLDTIGRIFTERRESNNGRTDWEKLTERFQKFFGISKKEDKVAEAAAAGGGAAGLGGIVGKGKETGAAEVSVKATKMHEEALKNAPVDSGIDIFKLMLKELQAIHACTCSKTSTAVEKASGQAKYEGMSAEEKASQKSIARHQRKEEKLQKGDIKLQKKDIASQKVGDKIQNAEGSLVNRKTKTFTDSKGIPNPDTSSLDPKALLASGGDMMKTAAAILVMGVGIVALGAAIVFISSKILGAFNLDLNTVIQTAAVVGAIAVAGGAIAAAGLVAYEALNSQEAQNFADSSKKSIGKILKAAGALMLLGPAIVLLGAAVVALTSLILKGFNLNVESTLATAGIIVAVAAVAGAMGKGVYEFVSALDELEKVDKWKKIVNNPKDILMQIGKISFALLTVGGAIMLLGIALVKMAQMALSVVGLDATTAATVATQVSALILGAGAIAGAVIGASIALSALGKFSDTFDKIFYQNMLKGAATLLLLAPAMTLLAIGLSKVVGAIMGVFGINAKEAGQVAYDVAGLILAAGAIAGSVLLASAGLIALGEAVPAILGSLPMMLAGAGALLGLVVPITLLAAGVTAITKGIMGMFGLNAESSAKTAGDLAVLLVSAGIIAGAVLGSFFALSLLGLAVPVIQAALPLAAAGAIAFMLLTPAITALAAGVIWIAKGVMKNTIDPQEAKDTSQALTDVIGAASSIAWSVLGASAGLAILGAALGSGLIWIAAGLAVLGAIALRQLTPAVVALGQSVIKMAGDVIKSGVSAEDSKATSEALASILSSASSIAWSVIKSVATLGVLGALVAFSPLAWALTAAMYVGSKALNFLTPAVTNMAQTIVKLAANVIKSGVSAKEAKEVSEALSSILQSASSIASGVLDSAKKLSVLGLLSGVSGYISAFMSLGTYALWRLSSPIKDYIAVVVGFAKGLGINPKQAVEMSKGVANILEATGEVTDQIMKTRERLTNMSPSLMGYLWGFFTNAFIPTVQGGIRVIKELAKPIKEYVKTIVGFAKGLGINPKQAVEMSKGVASIISACGEVTDQIIKTTDKLKDMSPSFWDRFNIFGKTISAGVGVLNSLKATVIDYVGSIVKFAHDVKSKVNMSSGKEFVKTLGDVSKIITLVSNVLNNVSKNIVPLTQGGWFSSSPVKKMTEAKAQMDVFFPAMIDFVKTIVNKVKGSLGNIRELKDASKSLQYMANILSLALPSINLMNNKFVPLANGGILTTSSVDKIKNAIPQFQGFFRAIGGFVRNIVVETKSIGEIKELKTASKKMVNVAQLMSSTNTAISSLANVMSLMDGGIFTKSPVQKISASKTQFGNWFKEIALFVNTGIVQPINGTFKDSSELNKAANITKNMSKTLIGTKVSMENLSSVMSLMDEGIFTTSPVKKISNRKDKFGIWFKAITEFVGDGIVNPVNNTMKGIDISGAAKTITNVAVIARNIVPMIKNLAAAISLSTDGSWWKGAGTMESIVAAKKVFKERFRVIAEFVRDGIVNPVNDTMKGIDIGGAAKIIVAMTTIAKNIVPLMKGLSSAVGLMSAPAEALDTDFPVDKIILYRAKFSNWFTKVSQFMLDGIITPILTILPEPRTINVAARILTSMNQVIGNVSKIITSTGRIVENSVENIGDFDENAFGSSFYNIASSINTGLLEPMKFLPASSELQEVEKQLNQVVRIFNNISKALVAMDKAMLAISDSNIDFSALDRIPIQKIAMFTGALKDLSLSNSLNSQSGASSVGGTPSDKAIESRLLSQQANAQKDVSQRMLEISNEATRGDGLLVRDLNSEKMQRELGKIQKEQTKNITNPLVTKSIDSNSIGSVNSKITSKDIQNELNKNLKVPASKSLDMRSASKTIGESVETRTMKRLESERGKRNEFTLMRERDEASRKQRWEKAGFTGPDEAKLVKSDSNTVATTATNTSVHDVHSAVANNKASTEPVKTEVMAPELGNIADQSNTQTDLQKQLVDLFAKVVDLLQPKSIPNSTSDSGGSYGNTKANQITHRPANYHRNTTGLVSQTAGKAVLNQGASVG